MILLSDINDNITNEPSAQTVPVARASTQEAQCGTVDYSFIARLNKRKQIEEARIFNSIIKRISHLCP